MAESLIEQRQWGVRCRCKVIAWPEVALDVSLKARHTLSNRTVRSAWKVFHCKQDRKMTSAATGRFMLKPRSSVWAAPSYQRCRLKSVCQPVGVPPLELSVYWMHCCTEPMAGHPILP